MKYGKGKKNCPLFKITFFKKYSTHWVFLSPNLAKITSFPVSDTLLLNFIASITYFRRVHYPRLRRSIRSRMSLREKEYQSSSNGTITRSRRQSTLNAETLCRTRTQYIVPRAALNNKGNWMYVVNMPEVDSRATQLVKTETCAWVLLSYQKRLHSLL